MCIRPNTNNKIAKEFALANQAKIFYNNAVFDSAVIYYNKAAVAAKEHHLYDTAVNFTDKALQIVQSQLDTNSVVGIDLLSETYLNKGKILYEKSWYNDAYIIILQGLEIYKRIVPLDSSSFEKIKLGEFYYQLALMSSYNGNFEEGRNYCDSSLQVLIDIKNVDAQRICGLVYSEIGRHNYHAQNFEKALESFQRSNQIFNTYCKNDTTLQAKSLSTLGVTYADMGMYEKALGLYSRALELVEDSEKDYMFRKFALYLNTGEAYNQMGEYEKTLEYWDKALTTLIQFRGADHRDIAWLYNNFARLYYSMQDYSNSLTFNEKALEIQLKVFGNKHTETSYSYTSLGLVYFEMGDYSNALNCLQKALVSVVPDFNDENYASNPYLDNSLSKMQLFTALNSKADVLYSRYMDNGLSDDDLELAIHTSTLAIHMLDSIRADFKPEGSRLILSNQTKHAFTNAVRYSFEKNQRDTNYINTRAFELSEKCKSNVLISSLFDTKAKQNTLISDSIVQEEKRIKEELTDYQICMQNELQKSTAYDTIKYLECEKNYLQLLEEKNTLMKYIEARHPEYIRLKSNFRVATVEDVQGLLAPGEAVLSYFLGDTTLSTFVITNEQYFAQEVFYHDTLDNKITQYISSIRKSEDNQFLELSTWFYDLLIEPVKKHLVGKKSLIIIPDEYLYYLPFETLVSNKYQGRNSTELAQINYLIKDYNISYNYSATLWQEKRKQKIREGSLAKKTEQKSFIGYAPVFKNHDEIYANNLGLTDTTVNAEVLRSLSVDGKTFNDLPHSQIEVNTIAGLFKQQGMQAAAKISDEATEESFKAEVNDYAIVHLATHGYANNKLPDFAWLAFSQQDEWSNQGLQTNYNLISAEDGILYSGEMNTLDLDADLVVLSACETGMGKLVAGEGLMAMTRGFLYSGASNIVFSMWKVQDKETAELMIDFYKEILDGNSYSESLRNAKLRMIENPNTSFPVFWSSFLLIAN